MIFDAEELVLYTLNETAAEIFKMIKKIEKSLGKNERHVVILLNMGIE